MLQSMRSKRFPPQKGKVLRGVHPKSHGCVAADFTVLKYIESRYRVGLFAEPKTYKAMIRFSNASVLQLPDLKGGNGSRGMAIKVLGVKGPIMLADSGARNQDFLMINTPEFAFANVRDYLRLSRVLMAHPVGADPSRYSESLVDACKPLRFTPWQTLAAHEPLGGINRLRKPVYCESGKFRPDGGDPNQVLCRGKKYK